VDVAAMTTDETVSGACSRRYGTALELDESAKDDRFGSVSRQQTSQHKTSVGDVPKALRPWFAGCASGCVLEGLGKRARAS
jgi:hypothetical protein